MSSILAKFGGEQSKDHNGQLIWPGTPAGYPVRVGQGQQAPLLKQHEVEECGAEFDFKFKMFDLDDDEDRKQYQYVMDRIVNGWFRQIVRQHHYDPATNRMRVYLEWAQVYGTIPNADDARTSLSVYGSR